MKKKKIIKMAIIVGLFYGCLSGFQNQNPYDHTLTTEAWHWQPSPIWLPSYILCKVPRNGFGITHTKSGYLFRSDANRILYIGGSTIVGGGMGYLAGWFMLFMRRGKKKRFKPGYGRK
jgi:hypothetical protein